MRRPAYPSVDDGGPGWRLVPRSLRGRWNPERSRPSYLEHERWLAGQLALILEIEEVGYDDDIWEIGLDSLGAIELCDAIADAGFGEINPTLLLDTTTVAAIAQMLTRADLAVGSSSVVLNPSGTATPIFALPGGGGTALRFHSLAQSLGANQPVVVIEPRGLHFPGPIDRTIEAMSDHACAEIDSRLRPGEPCVLVGFSAGATVAFEAAHRLNERGRNVSLILIDGLPGWVKGGVIGLDRPGGVVGGPTFVARLRARGVRESVERIPSMMVARLRNRRRNNRLAKLIIDPGKPSLEIQRYDAFRAIHLQAIRAYQPEKLPLAATLVRVGGNDIDKAVAGLVANLDVLVIGGDHDSMMMHPHVEAIAAVIRGALSGNGDASMTFGT